MNDLSKLLLHLSLIDTVGPALVNELFIKKPEHLAFTDLYNVSAQDISSYWHIPPSRAQIIAQGLQDKMVLEQELALIEKYNVSWCSILDDAYPALLKQIHLPPTVLYWQGKLPSAQENCLAFVGSRKANQYGQQVINKIVPPLSVAGWHIISGGAIGADSMIHKAVIEHGGKTSAIVGSGLLNPYPTSNKRLFASIIQMGGAIISPFSMQLPGFPGNFPARNRIIAGMAQGIVVVQAAEKSGTGITASFALQQGKDVYAVPGSIFDELSAGCHRLLAQGAKAVTSAYDIMAEYGYTQPEVKPAKPESEQLDTPTSVILATCIQPTSTDSLLEITGLPLQDLITILFDLQLQARLSQNMVGLWQAL
jgi:DNA processing protein